MFINRLGEPGIDDAAADSATAVETAASAEQMEDTDECRICRSSLAELREADAARCGGCRLCLKKPVRAPLLRLRCACTGSVSHVCARCYRCYYVARGIRACEICRQPTGLDEHFAEDVESVDEGGGRFCSLLVSTTCSDDARFLIYALFLTFAFVIIFVLFFKATGEDRSERQSGTALTTTPPLTTQPPGQQHRLERSIFVGVALVNLGVALAYICFSYWRHCRRTGRVCCCRCRYQSVDNVAPDGRAAAPTLPNYQIAARVPIIVSVGAVTLAIPQQPRQQPQQSTQSALPPSPPAPTQTQPQHTAGSL